MKKKKVNYTESFKSLREGPLGDAWSKVICVCRQLLRDDPCSLNCKEFHDESLPNEKPKE